MGLKARDKPMVSALMPIKAPAPWLHEAVDSVVSQTYKDLELICVLDGFDEVVYESLSRVKSVHLVVNRISKGPSAARRQAVEVANGAVAAPIDADDVWRPHHIETLIAALVDDRQISLVGTNAQFINAAGNPIPTRRRQGGDKTRNLMVRNQFVNSASAFWLNRAVACGSYNPTVRVCEDYDLWIRLATTGRAVLLDGSPTISYRKLNDSVSGEKIDRPSRRAVALSRRSLVRHLGYPAFLADSAQFAWEAHLARRRVERLLQGAYTASG